jgi:ABC-type Mn2+/Zn2+ transport system permease subunit
MAHALEWVGRIMAISALMVVPGIAGQWIDKRFGTEFLGLAGFVLGIVSGMAALIAVTSRQSGGRR